MEYKIINGQMRVYGKGGGMEYNKETNKWDCFSTLASIYEPISIYDTNNMDDAVRKENARKIKGAKLLYVWDRGNYIDDPYGRMVKVGNIKCEIWDFREVLGVSKPLEKCLDYETYEMLKNNGII